MWTGVQGFSSRTLLADLRILLLLRVFEEWEITFESILGMVDCCASPLVKFLKSLTPSFVGLHRKQRTALREHAAMIGMGRSTIAPNHLMISGNDLWKI